MSRRGPEEQARDVPAVQGGSERRPGTPFDREYYRRYYYDPRTAVTTRREMQARARLIAAFHRARRHAGPPASRRRVRHRHAARSAQAAAARRPSMSVWRRAPIFAAATAGRHGRIEEYRSAAAFDLVDLLRRAAIPRLPAPPRAPWATSARLCRGVLYFSALTRRDWEVELRPGANRFQRAPARRAVVPAAPAAQFPRGRGRLLAAPRRPAHRLGAGVPVLIPEGHVTEAAPAARPGRSSRPVACRAPPCADAALAPRRIPRRRP